MKLKRANVEFKANDVPHKFTVIHNMKGDIMIPLKAWIYRTKKRFTAESFCKYVSSKNLESACMTEIQFKRTESLGN